MRHLCEDCIARREVEAGAAARYEEWKRKGSREGAVFWTLAALLAACCAVAGFINDRGRADHFAAKVAATRAKAARTAPEMRLIAEGER